MAAARYSSSNDLRRQVGSPRSKARENKDTLCRNVLIYGHCRYEDLGCTFNHDSNNNRNSPHPDFGPKKSFNVESPSFTPSIQQQQQQQASKKSTFSSQAASAAPFTPRGVSITPTLPQQNAEATIFNPGSVREFTPATYDAGNANSGNGTQESSGLYPDPFTTMNSMGQQLPANTQFNPYATDPANLSGTGSAFYPHPYQAAPLQPPNYHLYQPTDGYQGEIQPWQRSTYDFFLPKDLREEMQKKQYTAQQVIPGSMLPALDRYHSLVPLDTNHRKSTSCFNYQSWIYKAKSNKFGRLYALRRLEGYRLTNENAILTVSKEWKKIKNACIVTVHDIFTCREFGDSSLIFSYDYHPMAKTLQEVHFPQNPGPRFKPMAVTEDTLWGYICQITTALQAIHIHNLAARCIELSKIIVDSNRIRLAACSILDVVQYESTTPRPVQDLQQEDLVKFGKLMLSLAAGVIPSQLNVLTALQTCSSKYSQSLKEAITWLLTAPAPEDDIKSIDIFANGISSYMTKFFDLALQEADVVKAHLARELENGRCVRLMMKLDVINDHPGLENMPNWAETGDRYPLKLFRDYVFHQVDRDGKSCVSLGHILTCVNKLDAGTDELVPLASPDNETSVIVSYRDVKIMLERSFNEILKNGKVSAGMN
ncbi:hypothetical protein B0T16DRAFT_318099 [Cercophora newfieldiana]|uniref:PAN2-PAN3 deadenylation complex subunit PAN3 n=1 Tax=Cercophora newfieldiana TaxID=92897 RepID=A0AA39YP69_9PEZI|nr:hypothetical protein B0T16DRAFT_318099 [Cercophora newfieldiana]